MTTEEQKNVFAELQKNTKTRGKGLSTPPNIDQGVNNVKLPEHSEAVSRISRVPRRTYRVSTFISENAGDLLDELILKIKKDEGKKPKIAEVIERALKQLSEN